MQWIFLAFLFAPAGLAGTVTGPCDDGEKVYKICADQEKSYQAAVEKARGEKKQLVVVLGAEWCPWCISLHRLLRDPKFGGKAAQGYLVHEVALYREREKIPGGDAVLERLKQAADFDRKIEGIPVLAIVNPVSGKASILDTEPLEKNTRTSKGHDPKKLLAAISSGLKATK